MGFIKQRRERQRGLFYKMQKLFFNILALSGRINIELRM